MLSHYKDFKYRYYQVMLFYCESSGQVYEDVQQYELAIIAGGEVCDSKMKLIHLLSSMPFQKMTVEENMPFIKLGWELKKRYALN